MSNVEEDIKLKEISERFNNGIETLEDIMNYCRNYEIKFENGLELRVVEKKYFDKLVQRIKKLEEENKKYIVQLTDEQYRNLVDTIRKEVKQEFEQKVKDLKESIILDNTIVGGRRNAKTLEYGIKLGKIKACEELLEDK